MQKSISLLLILTALSNLSRAQAIHFGLDGDTVNSLRFINQNLYAGTSGAGAFRRLISDTCWTNLGLEGKDIRSVYPYIIDGAGISMLAGINRYYSGDSTPLYELSQAGWLAADSGIDLARTHQILSISGNHTASTHVVYATGGEFRLYKRSMQMWTNILSEPSCNVVEVSPNGDVWVGGAFGGFVNAYIALSTDEGMTWEVKWADTSCTFCDNSIGSIAIDPSNSNTVYASGSGFVLKSTNAGTSWDVTLIPLSWSTLEIDPLIPTHIFCGESSFGADTARLFESFDGGATWQQTVLPEIVRHIQDLAIDVEDSLKLFIATSGDGVYQLQQFAPAFGIDVTAGWNMLSIPKHVQDFRKSILFPTAASAAFDYDGSYHITDTLVNGLGYWVKFSTPGLLRISSDTSIKSDTLQLSAGWNIIGSISRPVQTSSITSSPSGIVTSQFYTYHGSYIISDSIIPGSAYWVKMSQAGKLVLSQIGSISQRIQIVPSSERPPKPPDVGDSPPQEGPDHFALLQCYPNPFNPATIIRFVLPADVYVTLKVYNVLGQEVRVLMSGFEPAGYKEVIFDASKLTSGTYFYQLQAGSFLAVRKMMVLK